MKYKTNKSLKRTRSYYKSKSKGKIDLVVKRIVKKNGFTIYGARAINKQLPSHLKRITIDYDIYARNPRMAAKMIETKLDKAFRFNAFKVEPARHAGTFKIKSTVTGQGIVDITMIPKEKIGIIKRKGIRYTNLNTQLNDVKKSLSDKESAWRHDKDRDTGNRILLAKLNKQKKSKIKKISRKVSKKIMDARKSLKFSTKVDVKNPKMKRRRTSFKFKLI